MTAGEKLQALYDSEIGFAISAEWDRGFAWKLGDELNGYKAEGQAKTLDDAVIPDRCSQRALPRFRLRARQDDGIPPASENERLTHRVAVPKISEGCAANPAS